jgi:hypothetical protein
VFLPVLRPTSRGSLRSIAIGLRHWVDGGTQRVDSQLWRTGEPSHC